MDVDNPKRRRLRRLLACAAFLLAAASAVAGAVTGRAASKGPRLALSTASLDLGEGKPNEKLRGVLELTNNGAAPLEFELSATCGCSELSPRKGQIAPGERQEINIGLQLPGHAPSQQETHVTVQTNDPHQPVVGCHVVAHCPSPFLVSPAQLNFGRLFQDELTNVQRILEIRDALGRPVCDPELLRVARTPPHACAVKERAPDGGLRVRVTLLPELTPCSVTGAVELELNGVQERVNVPLHAEVMECVSIVPATIFLRVDRERRGISTLDIFVIDHRRREPLGAASIKDPPSGVDLIETGDPRASRRQFQLIVSDYARLERETKLCLRFSGLKHTAALTLINALR